MRKRILAFAAATTLAISVVGAPVTAQYTVDQCVQDAKQLLDPGEKYFKYARIAAWNPPLFEWLLARNCRALGAV
jgi:hypothetical protein